MKVKRKDEKDLPLTAMSKTKKAFSLFLYYFKIGWYTFGGGWSIVAQMQKDFVEDEQEITSDDLLDIVSVARSIPGTMIGNVAYLFGYHEAGVLGGIMSVLGIISPPLIILSALTLCYTQVKDFEPAAKALVGVRACVAPIILSAVLKLHKTAFPQKFCFVVFGIAVFLQAYYGVNCVWLILGGIVAGLIFTKPKEKGGEKA